MNASNFTPLRWTLFLGAVASVTFLPLPSAVALGLGAAVAGLGCAPRWGAPAADRLLKLSVIGLGAGMDLGVVLRVGLDGLGLTLATLSVTLLVGLSLGKLLSLPRHQVALITAGTAICGGSAIAAVAPVLRARSQDVGVAMFVVFALNAGALLLFPLIGEWAQLDAGTFGMWCALAIHDTSSVVGAAASHGVEALEVATAAKLARSLWIIPVALILLMVERANGAKGKGKITIPWFILGFVLAAALVAVFPVLESAGQVTAQAARHGLKLALFGIGLGMVGRSRAGFGLRPLLLGLVLWAALATLGFGLVHF